MTLITQNCIINGMPDSVYHSDPTPALEGFVHSASLSSSMVCAMVEGTEEQAFLSNRRLNPHYQDGKSDEMDLGTIAHEIILLGSNKVYEIAPVDAWRSADAKAIKANIESRGLIALNETTAPRYLGDVAKMKERLHDYLSSHKDYPGLMQEGKGEQSGFAFDGLIWNRARFDWLDSKYPDLIVDYKTTGVSFENWDKNQLWGGRYMQDPHYRRVFDLISGEKSRFVFVVQQTFAPFDVLVFEIDRSFMDDIEARYDLGRKRFIQCAKTGLWHGRPPFAVHSCPPPWVVSRWELDSLDRETEAKRDQIMNPEDCAAA